MVLAIIYGNMFDKIQKLVWPKVSVLPDVVLTELSNSRFWNKTCIVDNKAKGPISKWFLQEKK